ncbi:MAG: S1/P1 Nuclease [Sphingobacteriales bacterium]|nr:MAG: S1/P1 Nuclease [Sphingobacteriales bacterium]
MNTTLIKVICLLFIWIICSSWGFFAHQQINKLAVFTLPVEMLTFYKKNLTYITAHAIDPDKRRYADTLEAPRHYLDVENYEENIDSIPFKWKDAVAKYGIPKLNKNGIVPWHIQRTYNSLVNAFKALDSIAILRYSADLGHYIGDAHVPLHTTHNHNGQLTGQIGIHGFWESRIPEIFYESYSLLTGRAIYVEDPLLQAWSIVKHSHKLVDTVLRFEKTLTEKFHSDRKYSYSERKNVVIKQYSVEFSAAYQTLVNSMVERQMKASILAVGSFWYSAWADAGQPALKNFKPKKYDSSFAQSDNRTNEKFKKGILFGREL